MNEVARSFKFGELASGCLALSVGAFIGAFVVVSMIFDQKEWGI